MPAPARQSHLQAPGRAAEGPGSTGPAVAVLVLVAAALRLAGLDSGLWIDEILMLTTSAREPFVRIATAFEHTNQHTLYNLIAHASIVLFGESAWSIRLPACLFGILSVAMLYVLARRVLARTEALAATALLATSYHHIWYSQSARGYTIQGFCVLLATWALVRGLEHGRRQDWILYVAASVVGVYTHLTTGLVVVAHVLVLTLGWALRWRVLAGLHLSGFIRSVALAAVFSFVLYAPFLQVVAGRLRPNRASPAYEEVSRAAWTIAAAWSSIVAAVGLPAAMAGALVGLAGIVSLCRRHPLVGMLLIAPAMTVPLPFLALGRPFYPRFLFFMSGPAVLFLARGLGVAAEVVVPGRVTRRRWVVSAITAAGALAIVSASVPGLVRNYRVPKQDFAEALRFLEAAESAGARIGVAGGCRAYQDYYGRSDWPCLSGGNFEEFRSQSSSRMLVATTLPRYVRASVRERIRRECQVIRRFPGTLEGGTIAVCEMRGEVRR
jgi:4-amino-4-deoxy-L-arabinose transferase-like glycosyltransferase